MDKLTKSDVYNLTSYLLKRNAVPDVLKSELKKKNIVQDRLFEAAIAMYSSEEQQAISHYRDLVQQLTGFGISEDDYDKAYTEAKDNVSRLENTAKEIEELKTQYKNLQRLKYNYSLSQNEKFTYGANYGTPDKDSVTIDEDKDKTIGDDEDKRIEKEESKDRHQVTDPRAFAFSDRFFDSTHSEI